LSGLELLEKINADYKLKMKAIPFIFLSNSNSAKDVEQAYALGAQGYYVKPLLLDELSEIFKGIVNYWKMAQIPQSE
jgi:CheY-like chemotaxis protein